MPDALPSHSCQSGVRFSPGLITTLLLVLNALGCAHVISEGVRRDINPDILFSQVAQSTQDYIGTQVIWGGKIVQTRNAPDAAEVEVIQYRLDSLGEPVVGDYSGGRFIFLRKGFLEPEIYSKGRRVTGAGRVVGNRVGKLDESDYTYVLVEVEELHLFEKPYTGPPYFYDPFFYGYYPYFYGGRFGRPFGMYRGFYGFHGYPYWW